MTSWLWDDFMNKYLTMVLFYRKMLDPGLMLCSKQAMFLNLVYKSLKADIVLRRVKAFLKRLLQVTCAQMPPFICGALYLVSEILKAKPDLRSQLDDHPVYILQLLFKYIGF
jgi:ribosome biogenesis protein MAK21